MMRQQLQHLSPVMTGVMRLCTGTVTLTLVEKETRSCRVRICVSSALHTVRALVRRLSGIRKTALARVDGLVKIAAVIVAEMIRTELQPVGFRRIRCDHAERHDRVNAAEREAALTFETDRRAHLKTTLTVSLIAQGRQNA
jgi:hypothetical protein